MTPELEVPGLRGVFAVGDVAASDPHRSSARNRGDSLVAHNIRAEFTGRRLRCYRTPGRRWGSLLGIQADGLEVFLPSGHALRIPAWPVQRIVMPGFVRCGMYRGSGQTIRFDKRCVDCLSVGSRRRSARPLRCYGCR